MKKQALCSLLSFCSFVFVASAEAPDWWGERGVTTNMTAHDFHPVNQGQVKWIATKAYEELVAELPSSENTNVLQVINSFGATGNYRPANLGMLKYVAKPFYDRFLQEGFVLAYPWVGQTPADYDLANQGQLKQLFAFDLNYFDLDGNGLKDDWELLYFGALGAGLTDDDDGDQLSNIQEQHAGIDPTSVDTDGDGQSDWFEVTQAGSNPLGNDFNGSNTVLQTLLATNILSQVGSWETYGDSLYTLGWGGGLSYRLTLPTSGVFMVEIDSSQFSPDATVDHFYLSLFADGVARGEQAVSSSFGQSTTAQWMLPYRDAGTVDVRIDWRYLLGGGSLRIDAIRLVELGGVDQDLNGRADWLDYRLGASSASELPSSSHVSPVCFEGVAVNIDSLRIVSTFETQDLSPVRTIQDQWYADVTLSSTNTTTVIVENEAGEGITTNDIVWATFNLFDPPSTSLVLRVGDALLLNAYPAGSTNGNSTIDVVGVTNYTTDVSLDVPHVFDVAGDYVLNGAYGTNVSTQVTVHVVSGSFAPESPAIWMGKTRTWLNPTMPTEAYVESDPGLNVQVKPYFAGGVQLVMDTGSVGTHHMVARLNKKGPVLDTSIATASVVLSNDLELQEVVIWEDGTRLVRMTVKALNFSPDSEIHITSTTGLMFFADGSTVLILTSADFNELGEATVYFILDPAKTGGICHTLKWFQDGELVGRR